MQRYDVNDDVRTISLHFEKKNLPLIRGQLAQKMRKEMILDVTHFFHFFSLLQTLTFFFCQKGRKAKSQPHFDLLIFWQSIENTTKKASNSKNY